MLDLERKRAPDPESTAQDIITLWKDCAELHVVSDDYLSRIRLNRHFEKCGVKTRIANVSKMHGLE